MTSSQPAAGSTTDESSGAVAFTVNGRPCAVSAEPNTPLLYVLRNDLGLKGTRFGCGTGLCGACMVLIDDHPQHSCDVPLWAVAGKAVTTVEGLANEDALGPLQAAFVDEGAAQCGYCISGILVSAKALLDRTPTPSDDEIRTALEPHLCRCGAHARIVRAVRRASEVATAVASEASAATAPLSEASAATEPLSEASAAAIESARGAS